MKKHIYPIESCKISKTHKEDLLKQKGLVIWLTGLSGSGKTTLAQALEEDLYKKGFLTQILDGDNIRSGLSDDLLFIEKDRIENIRRVSEVAKLFVESGIITICAFISPTKRIRDVARKIIGEIYYHEVFVDCPLPTCMKRDVKGLYAKAARGEIDGFTGINSPYEPPQNPFIILNTDTMSLDTCRLKLLKAISPLIKKVQEVL